MTACTDGTTNEISDKCEVNVEGEVKEIPCAEITHSIPQFNASKQLDFIEIAEDGCAILGKSNLNSRFWGGSVWYYMNADDVPQEDKYLTGFDCKTGISDGKLLVECLQSIIIGKDTGEISIFCLADSEKEHQFLFRPEANELEHDDMVLSLSVSVDKSVAVSGSADWSIIKWKTDPLAPETHYRNCHKHQVTSVCTKNDDSSNICASCSLDGAAIVWDFRQPKPASVILDDPSCGLTAISWKNSNELIIGSSWGNLKFSDVRNKQTTNTHCFNRPIHRILPSPDSRHAAVCGDTHILKVFDLISFNPRSVYEDSRHEDFIHGLAWHPKTQKLYSCGWDSKVFSHLKQDFVEVDDDIQNAVFSQGSYADIVKEIKL